MAMDTFCGKLERGSTDLRDFLRLTLPKYDGQVTEVTVKTYEPARRRTIDQNSYGHAELFPKMARHWCMSVAHAKLLCMGAFWGWEEVTVGDRTVELPVRSSTSEMTVEEWTLFTDWFPGWAMQEWGVEIMLPGEWHARDAEREERLRV